MSPWCLTSNTREGSTADSLFIWWRNKRNFHRNQTVEGNVTEWKEGRNVHRIILITQLTKESICSRTEKALSSHQPPTNIFYFSPIFFDCFSAKSSRFSFFSACDVFGVENRKMVVFDSLERKLLSSQLETFFSLQRVQCFVQSLTSIFLLFVWKENGKQTQKGI